MTGISTTNDRDKQQGNGATTVFNFTFFASTVDYVRVYSIEAGVETEVTSGITKSLNSSKIGGTVSFAVAPTSSQLIVIRRVVPLTQLYEFAYLTRYKESAIEDALNVICQQVQQLSSRIDNLPGYLDSANVSNPKIVTPVSGSFLTFLDEFGNIGAANPASLEGSDLDTNLAGLASNDLLSYNGTLWVNKPLGSLIAGFSQVGTLATNDRIPLADVSAANGSRYVTVANLLALASSSSGIIDVQVFTSVGASTWTKPSGCNRALVFVQAGGAGGGGAGAGAAAGGNGGASSFGAHNSATGGTGGSAAPAAGFSTAPGVGSGGDVNLYGGYPGSSSYDDKTGGYGGGSAFGQPTSSPAFNGGTSAGRNATDYGVGGSGAGDGTNVSGGGAGGGFSFKYIASGLGSTETVTVGAGGTAGAGAQVGGAGSQGIVIIIALG